MLDLVKRLAPFRLAPNSPETDRCVEILKEELPFTVHEFPPGMEHNGWIVPWSWHVEKAEIRKEGKPVYDGAAHPLGVMGYAESFSGRVGLAELKKHLTFRRDWPNAVGYHCDYYYKPWLADWGFSVPYSLYENLPAGDYDIELRTIRTPGTMKVCEFLLAGKSTETVVLNAHNCHAAQANDDISGIAVGIEVMKRLAGRENRLSYRLIVCPEHLGTVFYLAKIGPEKAKYFRSCIFLESLGTGGQLALQESFTGSSLLDRAARHFLYTGGWDFRCEAFRKFIGNDETVWESPGFEVPAISLSRHPFPEYHTSMDNPDIIREDKLRESAEAVLGILDILETDCRMERKFTGLIALSNPKYDLYISPGTDPSIASASDENRIKWNYLMDCLPRYFDRKTTIFEIAEKFGLPHRDVYLYLRKFREKELIEFI